MSVMSIAPTVMACGTRAGEVVLASMLELPAATTAVTPELIRATTASSIAVEAPPPSDADATLGRPEAAAAVRT